MKPLQFVPFDPELCRLTNTEAFEARCPVFIYTVCKNDAMDGWAISVAYKPQGFKTGPFNTREEAEAQCEVARLMLSV